ncbi:hypothetical protein JCM19233_4266 [Vibrio astriarenae]|nr:hypothetical protein JCM19233_4266 [Vibrio sp. C7]
MKSVLSTTLDKPGVRLFSGVTQTSQETDLSFKVSGTIANIPAKLGDTIMADELIAELDDESYLVLLAQAKADVAKTFATQKKQPCGIQSQP